MERKEWKSFRKEMSANRKLRRCGKKLPRHCDVNCDNKIDLTEWFHCLNVKHMLTQTQPNGNFLNTYIQCRAKHFQRHGAK